MLNDLEFMLRPSTMRANRDASADFVPCPACKEVGHLSEKFFNGSIKVLCANCMGHGRVLKDSKDATCIHKYRQFMNVGPCLNTCICTLCGDVKTIDSSG